MASEQKYDEKSTSRGATWVKNRDDGARTNVFRVCDGFLLLAGERPSSEIKGPPPLKIDFRPVRNYSKTNLFDLTMEV